VKTQRRIIGRELDSAPKGVEKRIRHDRRLATGAGPLRSPIVGRGLTKPDLVFGARRGAGFRSSGTRVTCVNLLVTESGVSDLADVGGTT